MPCPEKFKETLMKADIPQEVIDRVNHDFENLVSSSPKKLKALYFKRATDILCENCNLDVVHAIYESNACCKGGAREKASKKFSEKYVDLTVRERLDHIEEVPYMGTAVMDKDGVICVNAVNYKVGDQFACSCSNYN